MHALCIVSNQTLTFCRQYAKMLFAGKLGIWGTLLFCTADFAIK